MRPKRGSPPEELEFTGPEGPKILTQLRVCPSIWLTQVFEDDFSLIDVLLCFTSPEIDVNPSLPNAFVNILLVHE